MRTSATPLELPLLDPKVQDVMPNPAEGVAGSGNTSLLQPTFELDGLRVQCPMEPSVEKPAAPSWRDHTPRSTGTRQAVDILNTTVTRTATGNESRQSLSIHEDLQKRDPIWREDA
jgi:hypothetical protein